jgi:hypothetical protein
MQNHTKLLLNIVPWRFYTDINEKVFDGQIDKI